jgi:hypothetical protein
LQQHQQHQQKHQRQLLLQQLAPAGALLQPPRPLPTQSQQQRQQQQTLQDRGYPCGRHQQQQEQQRRVPSACSQAVQANAAQRPLLPLLLQPGQSHGPVRLLPQQQGCQAAARRHWQLAALLLLLVVVGAPLDVWPHQHQHQHQHQRQQLQV